MMKLVQSLVVAALAIPAVSSFAQSETSVSRAQVRAELVQLQKAGYRVGDGDEATYPAQIQAAEALVAGQNGAATGYGGVRGGSSSSGVSFKPAANTGANTDAMSIYSGH
nr:DUF4148 domain-containing protein [Paraburkholderia caledonica]